MEVDLQRMKTEIERELRRIERRRLELKKQMYHIESVEQLARMAGESVGRGQRPEAGQEAARVVEGMMFGESKSWFRR
jgi:hypothetical protein